MVGDQAHHQPAGGVQVGGRVDVPLLTQAGGPMAEILVDAHAAHLPLRPATRRRTSL